MASDSWSTAASLATAGGTLVLAIATFASIRASNRSARTAERALLAGLRPVLMSSRLEDEVQKVHFQDGKWLRVSGGCAAVEVTDEAIYLAISLRNVGQGMAILHGWNLDRLDLGQVPAPHEPEQFRRLTRDLYVAPGDTGFWQGALRDPSEATFEVARAAFANDQPVTVDLLYGDHEGGQRVITRFALHKRADGEYMTATARHWNLDRDDPR
ncbi:MAG: hypothetical protein M3O28_15410 [Actinomycetota bacterium]|nr:hypothetical protein [Actinomycetota bacterium]